MTPDYLSPDNVLVVTFGEDPENDKNAYQALTDLKQLDSQGQIKIAGAAVVTRDGDGRVDVKSEVGDDPYVGTASGGMIGLLVGIIGGPLGVLIGGAYGVLVGSLFDLDDVETTESVLGEISKQVQPDADRGPRAGHRAEPRGRSTPRWRGWAARSCAGRSVDVEEEIAAAEEAQRKAKREARKELQKARVEKTQGRRTRQGRGAEVEAPSAEGRRDRIAPVPGGGASSPGAPPPSKGPRWKELGKQRWQRGAKRLRVECPLTRSTAGTASDGNGSSTLWEQEVGGSNPPAPTGFPSRRAKSRLTRRLPARLERPIWKVEGGAAPNLCRSTRTFVRDFVCDSHWD